MQDFGKIHRPLFLENCERERKQRRNCRCLLVFTALYMGGHIAWFLVKQL